MVFLSALLLPIQLWVVSENAHTVWKPPIAGQILLEMLLFLDAWVKCAKKKRVVVAPSLKLFGEREMKPFDIYQHIYASASSRIAKDGEFTRP